MPELLVEKKGEAFCRMPLSQKGLSIGRSTLNDLCLPDDDISRRHAEVTYQNGAYHLADCGSQGGILVNQSRVQDPIVLEEGVNFKIGSWSLTFQNKGEFDRGFDDDVKTCLTGLTDESATRVLKMDAATHTVMRKKGILLFTEPDDTIHKLKLSGRKITVGTHPKGDIVLNDEFVSGRHLEVEWNGSRFVARDLGSTNGTFSNGAKVTEVTLTDGVQLTLGKTKVTYSDLEESEDVSPLDVERFCGMVGKSAAMKTLFTRIRLAAQSEATILVQAESGCGKELVAKSLHDLSERRNKPYVIVNCGAISANLIESELFGHEKGAFTGALNLHRGAFEQADRGTIFLDEIGELPIDLQAKLLRILENQTLRRVGGDTEIRVSVRVVAATNRDLSEEVKKGRFREDLFFRLFVIPLILPPLRDRRDDIPLLASHFVSMLSPERSRKISGAAMDKLVSYSWPGNVRELRNVLQRAIIFSPSDLIGPDSVEFMSKSTDSAVLMNLADIEKAKILEAIEISAGNKLLAAKMLGIAKSTLFKKLHDFGLMKGDEKEE